MTNRAQRVGFTALLLAVCAIAAAAQLNPTVNVLSAPTSPVPTNCDQSVAPQAVPRVEVAQIPEPPPRKPMAPPPTASLKALLKDTQSAADRGDRDGFRDALARAKTALAAYPPGGEKNAAADVIRVYDDLDRIWSYQMDSATGAFFDATSAPGQIMRGYPGFANAMADQVLTGANGAHFYPTTETREFLVREAAARLKAMGVAVAARAPRTPRVLPKLATAPKRPAPVETSAEKKETKPETAVTEQKPVEHRRVRRHRAETKVAEVHEKPAKRTAEKKRETTRPAPIVTQKETKPAASPKKSPIAVAEKKPLEKAVPAETAAPVKTTSTAPPPETSSASSTEAPPAASATTAPASTQTTSAPATTTSAAPTTTPTATETTASDTTGTAGKPQPQSKGVILPIILIVVGIGVLIVLFRASS